MLIGAIIGCMFAAAVNNSKLRVLTIGQIIGEFVLIGGAGALIGWCFA